MQFGICARPEDSLVLKEAGADFLEGWVQPVLKPLETQWQPPQGLALPLPAYNSIFPPTLKITGPEADLALIRTYMDRALTRAAQLGSAIMVFGSGPARMIPDGWPRPKAEEQLVEVMRRVGPVARAAGLTIAMEPLNRGESNILNSMTEGLAYLRRAGAPGLTILCDFFHFSLEKEPLEHLDQSAPLLTHVHISEPEGRVAPGLGKTDFRPFFRRLKAIGYDRRITVECNWTNLAAQAKPTLDFLRREWAAA